MYVWDSNLSIQFNDSLARRFESYECVPCCITSKTLPILRQRYHGRVLSRGTSSDSAPRAPRWEGRGATSSRIVFGVECLQLQGVMHTELPAWANFSHHQLIELVGNAFSSCCVTVATIVLATVLGPHIPNAREVLSRRRKAPRG